MIADLVILGVTCGLLAGLFVIAYAVARAVVHVTGLCPTCLRAAHAGACTHPANFLTESEQEA